VSTRTEVGRGTPPPPRGQPGPWPWIGGRPWRRNAPPSAGTHGLISRSGPTAPAPSGPEPLHLAALLQRPVIRPGRPVPVVPRRIVRRPAFHVSVSRDRLERPDRADPRDRVDAHPRDRRRAGDQGPCAGRGQGDRQALPATASGQLPGPRSSIAGDRRPVLVGCPVTAIGWIIAGRAGLGGAGSRRS